jgi:hypothetical protein
MKQSVLFLCCITVGSITTYLLLSNRTQKTISHTPEKQTHSPSFSVENAPKDSLRGSIASLSGDVTWISRTATDEAALRPTTRLQQGESITTGKNGRVTITMNSCSFTLSPDSKINIIQTLPISLVIEQLTGEVTYTNHCLIPLSVRSGELIVSLENGEMKLSIDEKSSIITLFTIQDTAIAAYNDTKQKSTVIPIPVNTLLTFDPDSRSSTSKKIIKKLQ